MAITVGIDLGTTNSACAIYKDRQLQYIKFDHLEILPSCLYDDGKSLLIGKRAKARGLIHPEYYIASAKRKMGESNYYFKAGNKEYSPEDVATEVLKRIYNEIKEQTGESDISAIVTIPANFRDYALNATKRAGRRAGFKNVKTLKEPISSAIANGIGDNETNGKYIVIDLGGGTLDLSVVSVNKYKFRVLYTGGNPDLGGDDFTDVIIKIIEDEILNNEQYGYLDVSYDNIDASPVLQNIFKSNEEYLKLKSKIADHAEKAKIALSYEQTTYIDIPKLYNRNGNDISFSMELSRQRFEQKAQRLFNHFQDSIEDALKAIQRTENLTIDDIDKVIFAGGSMNLPKVKEIVYNFLKKEPLDKDLDKIVAAGAAIFAYSKFEDEGDFDKTGTKEKLEVSDMLYYNLGILVNSGELSPIIEKGSMHPPAIEKTRAYYTPTDYCTSLHIAIYEGNVLSNAKDPANKLLYEFNINGLASKPAGKVRVDVTFRLDEEGILHVRAEDVDGIAKPYDSDVNWNELKKQ